MATLKDDCLYIESPNSLIIYQSIYRPDMALSIFSVQVICFSSGRNLKTELVAVVIHTYFYQASGISKVNSNVSILFRDAKSSDQLQNYLIPFLAICFVRCNRF